MFDKNDIVKIEREFHIVDDLVIKIFIDINIIKSKGIILDIGKNVIIIDLCKNIQILFIFINHRFQTRITIFNNNRKKLMISSHFNVAISVVNFKYRSLKLLNDYDFLFES